MACEIADAFRFNLPEALSLSFAFVAVYAPTLIGLNYNSYLISFLSAHPPACLGLAFADRFFVDLIFDYDP